MHHIYAKMQHNVLNVFRIANNYNAKVSACKTISFRIMKSVGFFSFATARTCQWIPLLEGITLFHIFSNRFRPSLLSDIIDTISCTVTDIVYDGSERSLLSNVNFHHSFFFTDVINLLVKNLWNLAHWLVIEWCYRIEAQI